jgi:hypothetical protein
VIENQLELAHYGQVTTSRMKHIMWLTNLGADIQEAILFLPRVESGPDPIKEIDVRWIATVIGWGAQRRLSAKLQRSVELELDRGVLAKSLVGTARRFSILLSRFMDSCIYQSAIEGFLKR